MTRQEAIKGLKVLRRDFSGYKPNEEMFGMAIEALEQEETLQNLTKPNKQAAIEDLPSAERHSAWVYCEDEAGHDGFRCEKCDTFYPCYYEYYHSAEDFISDYNFCPNCGARMNGE